MGVTNKPKFKKTCFFQAEIALTIRTLYPTDFYKWVCYVTFRLTFFLWPKLYVYITEIKNSYYK